MPRGVNRKQTPAEGSQGPPTAITGNLARTGTSRARNASSGSIGIVLLTLDWTGSTSVGGLRSVSGTRQTWADVQIGPPRLGSRIGRVAASGSPRPRVAGHDPDQPGSRCSGRSAGDGGRDPWPRQRALRHSRNPDSAENTATARSNDAVASDHPAGDTGLKADVGRTHPPSSRRSVFPRRRVDSAFYLSSAAPMSRQPCPTVE